RAHAVLVADGDEGLVVRPAAVGSELDMDLGGRSEEDERLVEEVGSQVEEDTATLPPRRRGLPCPPLVGLPPLDPGLEAPHLPQRALGEQPSQGEELAVPPPVLEDGERAAELLGAADQLPPCPR